MTGMPRFLPFVERWFAETFREPTRPQREGWAAIASGRDTLIVAPTGSGKTLASFLWALDHLHRLGLEDRLEDRVYVVYISPLRALNNDIEKNLREPLAGIRAAGAADGLDLPEVRVAVRTGDTLAAARQAMTRRPPHVLITTPESLYILLTTQGFRPALAQARFVIVDEVHALMANKRAPIWRSRWSGCRRWWPSASPAPDLSASAARPPCGWWRRPSPSSRAPRHTSRSRSTPGSRASSTCRSWRRWTTS
jgi:ATP-dependent helicase Lhr and Lhr-like helicase